MLCLPYHFPRWPCPMEGERQCRVIGCNFLSAGRSIFLGTEIKSKRLTRLKGNPSTNQSPEECLEERGKERPNFGHCSGKFETVWSRAGNRSTREERTGLGAAHCHWVLSLAEAYLQALERVLLGWGSESPICEFQSALEILSISIRLIEPCRV